MWPLGTSPTPGQHGCHPTQPWTYLPVPWSSPPHPGAHSQAPRHNQEESTYRRGMTVLRATSEPAPSPLQSLLGPACARDRRRTREGAVAPGPLPTGSRFPPEPVARQPRGARPPRGTCTAPHGSGPASWAGTRHPRSPEVMANRCDSKPGCGNLLHSHRNRIPPSGKCYKTDQNATVPQVMKYQKKTERASMWRFLNC